VTRNGQRLRAEKDYQYDAAVKKLTLAFNGATSVTIEAAPSLF